jgi:hypothetical protein
MRYDVIHHVPFRSVKMTQEKEHQTRRGVVLYEKSPFMPAVQTKTRRVTNKRGDMMLINNDGEIHSRIAGFWESKPVDASKFVKLFVNGVKALAELTSAGTRVFELLYIEMQKNPNKDMVYLSFTGLGKSEKTISRSTFTRGISELVEKQFIAGMPAIGWYWVNPDFVWNGDRLTFVQEYYKVNTRKNREINTLSGDLFNAPPTDHSLVLPDDSIQAPQE